MNYRIYGNVKDAKTGQSVTEALIKLYLNNEELQQGKSGKNGFYKFIVDIDDSSIKGDKQLRITFEKEGYQMQEHSVLPKEGPFKLDAELKSAASVPKKSFKWLPIIIGCLALLVLLVGGVIAWVLLSGLKNPKIVKFIVDPNSIEVGQSALLSWETENASVVEIKPIGKVESSGEIKVQPIQTTEYTLIGKNEKDKTKTKTLSIEVKDTTPPSLKITHSPANPTIEDKVTITAKATDPGGINRVEILVNGSKVEECTGSVCIYEGGPYAPGSARYEAHAWDKSDNKGVTGPKSFTIRDIGAPEVSITLKPSSPTTKDKVTFTARAKDPGGINKVEILVNGSKVEECTGSVCIYEGGPYPPGSARYEAHAWDKSDNKGVTGPKSFTIRDIGAPEVSITLKPSSPTTKDKVTFTAKATDPGGINRVEILVNGSKVEECTGSVCIYEGGPYAPGSARYEAHAWDKSDNKGVTGPKSFTIRDIGAPEVSITLKPSSPTTKDKVTITAKAKDPGGINKVEILVNNKKVKECTGSVCVYEGGPYPPGSARYEAHAWDKSDNKGVTGPKSFTIRDIGAPKVNISLNPATPTTKDKVTFTAKAKDPGGINKVEILVNNKKVKECTGSVCIYEGGPFLVRSVNYSANAYDKAGNRASTGPKICVVKAVDITPPNVTIEHSPTIPNKKQKVTFTARAADTGGISKVRIAVNGKIVKNCTSSPCTFESEPYPMGRVNYGAYAYDKAGNKKWSGSKNLVVKSADIIRPKVSIGHSPVSPNTKQKVTFTARAADAGGISKVRIAVNGKIVKSCTSSPCVYEGGSYPIGRVNYGAYAYDKAGNKKWSGSKNLVVKSADITRPKVSIGHSPASPHTKQKVTFTAKAADAGGISKVQIMVNGKLVKSCSTTPCVYLGGPYPVGSVKYSANAYDKAGNKASTGSKAFTSRVIFKPPIWITPPAPKDITPPSIAIRHSPASPNTTQKVTFTAKAADAGGISKVQIMVNGKLVKSCSTTPCVYVGGAYPAGRVNYSANAYDKAGNKASTGSKALTSRVIFTPPIVPPIGITPPPPAPKDITPPSIAIRHSPASPNTIQKVTFTASAKDAGGISKVQIMVNGKLVKDCSTTPCVYVGGAYPAGSVKYGANAYDKAGNKASTGSKALTVSRPILIPPIQIPPIGITPPAPKDITPPSIAIRHSPASPNTIQKVTFTASAKDAGGISKVEIMVNGKLVKSCSTTPCVYLGGAYAAGSVNYSANAYDKAGNKASTGSKALTVSRSFLMPQIQVPLTGTPPPQPKDITPPSITIGHNPASPNTTQKVTFTASARDAGGISKVQIMVNGKLVKSCSTSPCVYLGGAYPAGSVNYSANAYDKAGNKKLSGSRSLTVSKPILTPIQPLQIPMLRTFE